MEEDTKKGYQKINIKRLLGFAVALAILTCLGVKWFVDHNRPPYVKEDVFVFAYGETIPTDSAYYLNYDHRYADEQLDISTYELNDLGEYDISVTFNEQSYVLHIAIQDQEKPIITFLEGNPITLYRVNDEVQTNYLFEVEDLSEVTIDEITPALTDMKSGNQEICVTASDSYQNTAKECKTVNVEVLDYANTSTANSAEEIVNKYMRQYRLNSATFGFFYYSMDDEETYVYNGDGVFNAASTIKVPLNMMYYDKLAAKELKSTTSFTLNAADVEIGDGRTAYDYKPNQAIPLSYLQYQSIVNSDNTATNVLIRNLGGFTKFRSELLQYSDAKLPSSFAKENIITPNYMLDVLNKLYHNQDVYSQLIANMKEAYAGLYLQADSNVFEVAQKHGLYDENVHVVGIVYTPQSYIIGIYTNDVVGAENLISALNKELISYQLTKAD